MAAALKPVKIVVMTLDVQRQVDRTCQFGIGWKFVAGFHHVAEIVDWSKV